VATGLGGLRARTSATHGSALLVRPERRGRNALAPVRKELAPARAVFPDTTEGQIAAGSSDAMGDTAPGLASWDVWHANGGEVGYDSETEGDRVREEDEAAEDSDVLLSLQDHITKNARELMGALPAAEDLIALAPGGEIAGKDRKAGVKRLREAIERVGGGNESTSAAPSCIAEEVWHGGSTGERPYFLLKKAPASELKSRFMHPSLYRPECTGSLSLESLARVMGVGDVWREMTACLEKALDAASGVVVDQDAVVQERLARVGVHQISYFDARGDSDEEAVSAIFSRLIEGISRVVCGPVRLDPGKKRKFSVGGMLALPNFCVQGITDSTYKLRDRRACFGGTACDVVACSPPETRGEDSKEGADGGYTVLTAEFKTVRTFPDQNLWYRGARGVQTAAAMWSGYAANPRAPALLLSPRKFKLLLLVPERGGLHLYHYPGGYASGNCGDADFLKMLGILVLSGERLSEPVVCSPAARKLGCRLQSEEKATAERPHMGLSGACSMLDGGPGLFGDSGVTRKGGGEKSVLKDLDLNVLNTTNAAGDATSKSSLFDWTGVVWTADVGEMENTDPGEWVEDVAEPS
jgi:hypothetical protein